MPIEHIGVVYFAIMLVSTIFIVIGIGMLLIVKEIKKEWHNHNRW